MTTTEWLEFIRFVSDLLYLFVAYEWVQKRRRTLMNKIVISSILLISSIALFVQWGLTHAYLQ